MAPLAVAWDVDGTLIDSEPLHHRALVEVCREWGIDLSGLAERAFRGIHMEDVWSALRDRMPPGADRQSWLDAINAYYLANREKLLPMPNALETVAALASKGLRQVCVSNSNRSIVDANIRALKIERFIEFSVSLDDVARGKPDPCPYARCCERLGLQPSSVIAVEDTRAGIESAHAAGLVVLAYAPTLADGALAATQIDDLAQVIDYC